MDEFVYPVSSCSSPSPASLFCVDGSHGPVVEFMSCEIPEQWLGVDDDGLHKLWDGAAWREHSADNELPGKPSAPTPKRRGRKPGPRADGTVVTSDVEAERQRRDKINRRFCELRAAVPVVSRMDKASLLADATSYIAELRGRVEQLEAEVKKAAAQKDAPTAAASTAAATTAAAGSHTFGLAEKLEVRMVWPEAAAVRLASAARHVPARLMDALRSLDLPVQHACACRVGGATVLDVVVEVPAALQNEACLCAALLLRLRGSS